MEHPEFSCMCHDMAYVRVIFALIETLYAMTVLRVISL